jgi:hypothetical protein
MNGEPYSAQWSTLLLFVPLSSALGMRKVLLSLSHESQIKDERPVHMALLHCCFTVSVLPASNPKLTRNFNEDWVKGTLVWLPISSPLQQNEIGSNSAASQMKIFHKVAGGRKIKFSYRKLVGIRNPVSVTNRFMPYLEVLERNQ